MNLLLIIIIINLNIKTTKNKFYINEINYKSENKISKDDTVEYVDQIINELEELTEKENLTKEDKEKIKKDMIEIKDFMLKNTKIKGETWSDLSKAEKKKVYNYFINIDKKLNNKFPDYKNKLKISTKNEYNKIKIKFKQEINNYIKKAGKEKIKEQKQGIKKIGSNIKNKIKKWLNG